MQPTITNSVKTTLGRLKSGDVQVNLLTGKPGRTVKARYQARAPGYVIIEYTDGGERGGGHKDTEVLIVG